MTVLVVDDQIHVVEGIVLGVRWDRLDVSKVFKAYNALEARAVMRDHRVDILLCDIEMPSESGLELLQWVREEKGETKCIFLTAHPEFEYALAAIRLGGFDYIVQPAPFEEIEKAVRLACESIRREREINKFYTYGKALSGEKARMLAGILSAWFLGRQRNLDNIQKMLCEFEVFLEPCAPVYPAVFQICRWPAGKVSWEYDLLLYAFSNILEEVFQHTGQNVLPSPLDQDSFAFLVYPQEAAPLGREAFAERLERLLRLVGDTLGCGAACYTCRAVAPSRVADSMAALRQLRANNVALSERIFFYSGEEKGDCKIDFTRFNVWKGLLAEGYSQAVEQEVQTYLDGLAERLNARTLHQFHQAFSLMVFTAAGEADPALQEILQNEEALRSSREGEDTVGRLRLLIHDMLSCFSCHTQAADPADQGEAAVRYIRSNIEEDLHRSDIAAAVHLNPNYLSGLFKSRMGVSLKEFIVEQKMRTAQLLLKTTSLPISTVSARVGYLNFSYFSQVYKKYFGISPGEDRQEETGEKSR